MPDLSLREWAMLGPIAAAVLWMGVYPESFLAPMRADIAVLEVRLARAAPARDSALAVGEPREHAANYVAGDHAEGSAAAEGSH